MTVAVVGIYLGQVGEINATRQRHRKEEELLRAGSEILSALESYRNHSHGSPDRYPKRLEDLLLDPRVPQVRRHLRQIYADPLTQSQDWGLILDAQRNIIGVYSKAPGIPQKQSGFPDKLYSFEGRQSYQAWRFQMLPEVPLGRSLRR